MKTIKEHFELFPEPYRIQALENTNKRSLRDNVECISTALGSAFFWDDSPQGWDYWNDFYNKLEGNENRQSKGIENLD